jgi:hypothetical protein
MLLAGCQNQTANDAPDAASEQDMERDALFVDRLTVTTDDAGEHQATLVGHFPSVCSEMGGTEVSVEGDTILIEAYSLKPVGVVCAQQLTPFEETVALDLSGVAPGTYTVVVNGGATTSLTIE